MKGMYRFLVITTALSMLIMVRAGSVCSINYPQECGYLSINYPFNIQGSNCGRSNFTLLCKNNATFGQGSIPFISTPTGEYQVLSLSYDSLLINVTHLKAISCNASQSAHQTFSLPKDGPFTISGSNVFASVGCNASGSFFPGALQLRVGGMCGASCLKIYHPEYCNGFGCCQIALIENWRSVDIAVVATSEECVFSTILDPSTFKRQAPHNGRLGAGTYALKLDWGIKADTCGYISENQMSNLTCSRNAHCLDVTGMPGYKVCKCDKGYKGDGYQEGVHCTGMCGASCLKIYHPEYCNGFGCCQIALIENWRSVDIAVVATSEECVFSTILDPMTFKRQAPHNGGLGAGTYALKLDWGIKADTCGYISANQMGNLTCSRNAHCLDVTGMPGYKVCKCHKGYKGDGYQEGVHCTDINECDISQKSECIPAPVGGCVNMNGSYSCFCVKGKGDGKTSCTNGSILAPMLIGIFTSLVGGPLIAGAMFWVVKKRKEVLLRRKYFLQNKGFFLQEYISSDRGRRKATIFSEAELVKATNNFSEDLKVGVGGFGNVYKGKLAEGRLVAIKKCKEVDEEQIDQFINEVIILTQINHRNIIRLLGCCLETRIPLLVYEYVSNGTLFDHLHGKDGTKLLTWDKRLEIAIESAEAVAYLHFSVSVPIVHRDIKSANILLDSTCSVKLSDFGLSRLMPTGNTHLTTGVKGTLGYVDPQYYKTVQLTNKTDVYSFGVIMMELLTSMKAMSVERAKEERILADLFLSRKAQGLIAELFDAQLDKDQMDSMTNVANLAEACLSEDVTKRPSMKEILQELVFIRSSNTTGIRIAHYGGNIGEFKVVNEEETTSYKRKQPLRFNVKSKVFHSSPEINMSIVPDGLDRPSANSSMVDGR